MRGERRGRNFASSLYRQENEENLSSRLLTFRVPPTLKSPLIKSRDSQARHCGCCRTRERILRGRSFSHFAGNIRTVTSSDAWVNLYSLKFPSNSTVQRFEYYFGYYLKLRKLLKVLENLDSLECLCTDR